MYNKIYNIYNKIKACAYCLSDTCEDEMTRSKSSLELTCKIIILEWCCSGGGGVLTVCSSFLPVLIKYDCMWRATSRKNSAHGEDMLLADDNVLSTRPREELERKLE